MADQPDGVHTIPVPYGWSIEEAWEAIRRGDLVDEDTAWWANVEVKDGRVIRVFRVG